MGNLLHHIVVFFKAGRMLAGGATLAAASCVLSCLLFAPIQARGEGDAAGISTKEGSVLVATRFHDPTTSTTDESASPSNHDSLQPTSESTVHTPDIAPETESDDAAAEFGAALSKGQPTRVAARPAARASDTPSESDLPTVPFQPVKFQGITVAESTKAELIETWGEPSDTIPTDEGSVLVYDIEPFQLVEVLLGPDDIVHTIKVTLAASLEPNLLAEQLSLSEIEPVTVNDSEGQPLGQAFPERGVLFMFETSAAGEVNDGGTPTVSVSQVAIQPLDSRAFAMRAENRLHGPYAKNINDLRTAVALDSQFAHARWLLSEVYMATGQADLADAEAAAVCQIEPDNAAYQLRRGQTLGLLGEYDDAVHRIRAVLDRKDLTAIVQAQALYEMARLASLGDVEIASKAIPFNNRAIELADHVATSEDYAERRAAKQVLVDAHLAVAEEIARQAFNQKVESISQWIGRASGLAEEYIENDGGSVMLRLIIAQRALNALASFKPTLDPTPWVDEAEQAAETLLAECDDELWQQRIKWELGITYHNAMRVEHSRRQTAAALSYGQKAIENLAIGALSRQAVHSSEQLVGQLYFQMGAIYAVHQQDHTKAVQWYDKAAPLLNGPRPVSELYSPRREGEMLVSIGVSYWQLGQQTRALDVTQDGAKLIERAVEDGILAKSSLAVPYGNLATMYEQMGENTNAAKYTELAKSVQAARKPAAKVSRAGGNRQGNARIARGRMPRVTIQREGEPERPFVEAMRK